MNEMDYERLAFRRQFILSGKNIEGLEGWEKVGVGMSRNAGCEMILHAHPDLCITVEEADSRRAILIGYFYDWEKPESTNRDILKGLMSNSEGLMDFIEGTYELSGRFVIIYEDESECALFHDAGGQREVYYHIGEEGLSMASQLPILQKFARLKPNGAPGVMELYNSEIFLEFKKQWVGEQTIYEGVKLLRPNHLIDIKGKCMRRYWPAKPLDNMEIGEAAVRASTMMKGMLRAASLRSDLIIPVTAGWDSRLILAASKDIREKVKYYVIKFAHMDDSHEDVRIPRRICERLGIDFEVITPDGEVDEGFANIFSSNTAYAKMDNLPGIYGVFFRRFEGKVNVSSQVSEVIRSYRGDSRRYEDGFYETCVAYGNRSEYYDNDYVRGSCEGWLKKGLEVSRKMNIDPFALMYWEQWLVWEASQRSETDIAIEEYPVFNSRKLMQTMLCVKPHYRNKYTCPLYRRMMNIMWPNVLCERINPSFKRIAKGALVRADMFYPVRNTYRKMKGIKRQNK